MKAWKRKTAVSLLVISLATPVGPSRAEMIATDATLNERARIAAVLARSDVREHLVMHGVDATQVEARVAALTDADAALIAAELDQLPAGGRPEAVIYLVLFIVLLPVVLVAGAVLLAAKAISVASR